MPHPPHPCAQLAASPTALVTGGAKRLGRAIALSLARNGWNVAIHYRNSQAEAEQTAQECCDLGGNAAIFAADLDAEEQVRGLLPAVIGRFGTVHAVVNNASTFEHDQADTFTYAAMQRHLRTNTGAAIILAQALHAQLSVTDAAPASGAVVNLLDQKLWNQNPDFLSYTLSKAALEAASTMLSLALSPLVRVVGVAPGLTLTSDFIPENRFAQLHRLSPLGKSSTPEDIASAVLFALKNRSITGTTLLVDGGQHLARFDRDFSMMDNQNH